MKFPRDWRIHLHCFRDDWTTCQKWMEAFRSLKFGFTANGFQNEVVKKVPEDRILLETDAPYFVPYRVSSVRCKSFPSSCPDFAFDVLSLCILQLRRQQRRLSHPGMVFHVAAQVASVRKVRTAQIIAANRRNIHEVYGIKIKNYTC